MNGGPQSSLLSDTFLAEVGQLEPESDAERIRIVIDELREAEREMRRVAIDGIPLAVGFSSRWPEGAER
jgi:hypothetical protein